jgi:hypothetical protein
MSLSSGWARCIHGPSMCTARGATERPPGIYAAAFRFGFAGTSYPQAALLRRPLSPPNSMRAKEPRRGLPHGGFPLSRAEGSR